MQYARRHVAAFYLVLASALPLVASCTADEDGDPRNALIRDVHIVDGTGGAAYPGDVRLRGGRIAAISMPGILEPGGSETVIEAQGLVLAPGFIDTHSHANRDLLEQPDAVPATSQGITTIVVGQDGGSPLPLKQFFGDVEQTGTAINVASYVGHNSLRRAVLGRDYRRTATAAEVSEMAELLDAELASGALGLSTGLEYEPGIYSAADEVLTLAQLTADRGGRYISHVRSEDRWFEEALDEIIGIGRVTGMPVQVSHIKLAMKRLWGEAPRIIDKLNRARAAGIDISADIYPYEYWQSNLMVLLPERDYTDRAAIEEALDQIAPPDGLWMTRFDPNPAYVGMTLTEIAAERGVDPAQAFMQLAGASERMEEETGEGADAIIGTSMIESDIHALLLWPHTNLCTDGAFDDLHPRARGAFPRVLGRYVREQQLMTLEEAVHRMTGLAAEHMGFTDRGVIKVGAEADLVLFDPETIIDHATPSEPERLAEGVHAVWVAGEIVYESGHGTEARPGTIIRRDGAGRVTSSRGAQRRGDLAGTMTLPAGARLPRAARSQRRIAARSQ